MPSLCCPTSTPDITPEIFITSTSGGMRVAFDPGSNVPTKCFSRQNVTLHRAPLVALPLCLAPNAPPAPRIISRRSELPIHGGMVAAWLRLILTGEGGGVSRGRGGRYRGVFQRVKSLARDEMSKRGEGARDVNLGRLGDGEGSAHRCAGAMRRMCKSQCCAAHHSLLTARHLVLPTKCVKHQRVMRHTGK